MLDLKIILSKTFFKLLTDNMIIHDNESIVLKKNINGLRDANRQLCHIYTYRIELNH